MNSFKLTCTLILILALILVLGAQGMETQSGSFSVLTYNVAGLPEPLSGSRPIANTGQISPLLNRFDMALVQEDFWYHKKLASKADHPHISMTDRERTLGDGLGRFSRFPFTQVRHVNWEECAGYLSRASDCMTNKGFSLAVHTIAPGVEIDVYNVHMDAGDSPEDTQAKQINNEQLINFIMENSRGHALIVAGDFNLAKRREPDLIMLEKMQQTLRLEDACLAMGGCHDRIDRIYYRSSEKIILKATGYKVEHEAFQDKKGRPLSDHLPVSAVIHWEYGGM